MIFKIEIMQKGKGIYVQGEGHSSTHSIDLFYFFVIVDFIAYTSLDFFYKNNNSEN